MLQELCPHCGIERVDDLRPCPACGHEPAGSPGAAGAGSGLPLEHGIVLGLAAAAIVAVVIVSGFGFRPPPPSVTASESAAASHIAERRDLPEAPPPLGNVVFAEGLDASMDLESRRWQFSRGDTIAWRAEFVDAPRSAELTVIIAWQSIRERMELSRDTVALVRPGSMTVVRGEVAIDDLVPTAGMYSVSYYEGEAKVAEGVFEVLPPER